jgi:hypothetical protein
MDASTLTATAMTLERSTDTTDLPADGEDLPTRQAMELAEVAERCTRN